MSRKQSNALLTKPLIIIMVLSLALPIATYFMKYVKTKQRYEKLNSKFETRQKEFEDTVLYKIGSVDKIQRKRRTYDKVNKTLKARQCTSVEVANELFSNLVKNISYNSSKRETFRIQATQLELDRSNLPGYDTILRERLRGKASINDFWRIMSQLTRIGYDAFYCNNKECALYEVAKKQEELENVKSCPECNSLLKKGIISKFNYVEKFKLNTTYFKQSKQLDIDITIAIPISKQTAD